MLSDLTLGVIRSLDLHIHPFVSSLDAESLFLIPHVILNSRPEENVLRVCASARPRCYKPIANAKEEEMRDSIQDSCPDRYSVLGPLKLPDPKLPDIDILIKDRESSALLIGELKWLRKATRVVEMPGKDSELEEGFRQLRDIRSFLEQFPNYLRDRGLIERGEAQPSLSFVVIARDHLSDTGQQDDLWIAEFDALIWALKESTNLKDSIRRLRSFEWLPVEGRDFTVRFEPSVLAGVTVESEIFHRVEV